MTSMRRNFLFQCAALGAALTALPGCGSVKGAVNGMINFMTFKGTRLPWKQVVIAAAEGANLNSPTAVDIVLVLEEPELEKLSALPASKWFQVRADMLRTFPGTFIYKSWEVAPGQTLRIPGDYFGSPNVVGVFVFADYLTPGEHRMRLEQLGDGIIVQLGAREFALSPYKPE
jgi:type VI secretion system protein